MKVYRFQETTKDLFQRLISIPILNLEICIYVHLNSCLEMGADIHYCLPAECTSFLSTLGYSIVYPCRRVDVKFQVFSGRIEFQWIG